MQLWNGPGWEKAEKPKPDEDEPCWPTPSSTPVSIQDSPMPEAIAGLSAGQRDVCAAVHEVKQDVAEILRLLKTELGDIIRGISRNHTEDTSSKQFSLEKRKTKHVRTDRGTVLQTNYVPEQESTVCEEKQRKRKTTFVLGDCRWENTVEEEPQIVRVSRMTRMSPPGRALDGLKLRQGLEMSESKPTKGLMVPTHTYYMPAPTVSSIAKLSDMSGNQFSSRIAGLMQDPSSIKRSVYCMCTLAMLLLDLAVIPYVWAFTMDLKVHLESATYMACTFWTVDIVMTFFTGFYHHGELELSPCKVAKHYLRTWFVPDVMIVLMDWVSLFLVKHGHAGRFLRLVGVVRVCKIKKDLGPLIENLPSSCGNVAYTVLVLLVALSFNHWVACAWIFIGLNAPTETEKRWATDKDLSYTTMNTLYQYTIAFQWSTAQLMMTDVDIGFQNTIECVFTILCQVGGLLACSTLVSVLSSKLVEWHLIMDDQKKRKRRLQQFLDQNNVERRMYVRIQRQVRDRDKRPEKLVEGDVAALQVLSAPMLQELRVEICRPHINTSPLFRLWFSLDPTFVHRMCNDGIELTVHRPQDHLFYAGTEALCMYYLISGEVDYCQFDDFGHREVRLRPSERWLSEAALWTEWFHVGTAEAATALEVLRVEAAEVIKALKDCQTNLRLVTLEYSNAYHKRLVSSPLTNCPTDLTPIDYSELIGSMSQDMQIKVGVAAVDVAQDQHAHRSWRPVLSHASTKGLDRLKEEIVKGKSTVLLNSKGELERYTMLVALKIQREDGKVLVQLLKAESDQSETKPCCQLPGAKRTQGECINSAASKVLKKKLSLLQGNPVHIQDSTKDEEKESKDYGVKTKYIKTEMLYQLHSAPGFFEVSQDVVEAASSTRRRIWGYESFSLRSGVNAKDYYAWMTEKEFRSTERELQTLLQKMDSGELLGHWLTAKE